MGPIGELQSSAHRANEIAYLPKTKLDSRKLLESVSVRGMSGSLPQPSTQDPIARRVLVVEDDWDSAEALEAIIQHAGYEVRVARSAAEANALAGAFQPQIALVDIGLPDVSGYQLAAELRTLVAECRLIAASAHAGSDFVARSLAAGFETHLTKPLEIERLLRVLARE